MREVKISWMCTALLGSAVISGSISAASHSPPIEVPLENATEVITDLLAERRKEPKAGAIRLKSVSFSGPTYRAVRQDDNLANYEAPHWEDLSTPPDGDALDLNDRKFPVSFVRSSIVRISAAWIVDPPAAFQNARVRGIRSDGVDVPPTRATLSGDVLSITEVAMDQPLAAKIRFYNEFVIRWEVSLADGGQWFPAGNSGNRMYVTLSGPAGDAVPFESVMEIGARNADGESDPASAVTKIWDDFKSPIPGVKRKFTDGHNRPDGTEMLYWNPPDNVCHPMEEMLASRDGNGKCDAWAHLLHQVLQNLGLPESKVIRVTSIHRNDDGHQDLPGVPASETRGVILIKDWTAPGAGTAPIHCPPFTHQVDEVQDQPGIPGQGNAEPPGSFVEHFIVQIGSEFYDPSYGQGPFGSQEAWEDASISHFGKVCVIVIGQHQGKVFKTNTPGVETVFEVVP